MTDTNGDTTPGAGAELRAHTSAPGQDRKLMFTDCNKGRTTNV